MSFIGLGVSAPMPSLGSLASDAEGAINVYPYLLFIPAIMKRKQFSFIILAAVPMILASCQQNVTSTASSGATSSGYAPALNSSADHYNDTYAGYEVDLDGDGTIAATEKGLTWANSYDKIISTIKTTTDEAKRFKLMHAAETELMSTGAICPIYYYTDLFLKKETMTGYFGMP